VVVNLSISHSTLETLMMDMVHLFMAMLTK
jgi:hypothetical protein